MENVTGVGEVVGDSGRSFSRPGLAFDANDKLFVVNRGGEFYQVDPETGAVGYRFDVDQTAHHGDFDPLTGNFFGVGNTFSTTPLVIIKPAMFTAPPSEPSTSDWLALIATCNW